MTVVKTIGLVVSALIAVGSIASDACGEAAQDFYRNKQVRLIVGHPVGNDHDVGGRLLARYLGKHIPGRPSVIVQNMTAAASVAAATMSTDKRRATGPSWVRSHAISPVRP